MATIAALKATKAMRSAAKVVKKANKVSDTIDENQRVFKFGKAVLGIFGIPNSDQDDLVMEKLREIQSDVQQGFHEVQTRLDELQLSNKINEPLYYINFHYQRINEINADNTDPTIRDRKLTQLLLLGTGIYKANEVLQAMNTIKEVILGRTLWTPSAPLKSLADIIHDTDKELAGDERFNYLNPAIQYYSYILSTLYEGMFTINFIEAFFNQDSATEDTLVEKVETALGYITECEDESPAWNYKDYYEMKLYTARAPNTFARDYDWFLMTCGEYVIYDTQNKTLRDGPYRLGSTLKYKPPAGFNNIPAGYYHPDAVYSERANAGSDDYYFFFKGDTFIKYWWDKSSIEGTYTIPSNLPCSSGIVAAAQNPNDGYTFLFNNVNDHQAVHSYRLSSKTWYQQQSPTYNTVKVITTEHVDGGGVWVNQPNHVDSYSGRNCTRLYIHDGYWKTRAIDYGIIYDTPTFSGLLDVWHLEELMNRDAPPYTP